MQYLQNKEDEVVSDPTTGIPIDKNKCVDNKILKAMIKSFLMENPWAWEYVSGTELNWREMEFDF